VVSLDGPQPIHDRIRNIPRAFERLAEGVAAVRDAGPGVQLTGRCTVQRANFDSLCATVDAAHEIRLDRISFLAADVSSDAFNRPGGWAADRVEQVALEEDDLPRLDAELEALGRDHGADFQSGFIAESPEKLQRRLGQYFRALLGHDEF